MPRVPVSTAPARRHVPWRCCRGCSPATPAAAALRTCCRPAVPRRSGRSDTSRRRWIAAQVEDGSLPEPARVVVPVGTGGTAAGLALGFQLAGLRTRVVGVVVNDQLRLDAPVFARLARRTAKLLERRGARLGRLRLDPGLLDLTRDQIGAGYGHPTEAAKRAAALAAEERLALDPVYTAKAMAGLLALRAEGRLGDPVLFIHTDGPR
jgi:D-cysteine desulfhydrase